MARCSWVADLEESVSGPFPFGPIPPRSKNQSMQAELLKASSSFPVVRRTAADEAARMLHSSALPLTLCSSKFLVESPTLCTPAAALPLAVLAAALEELAAWVGGSMPAPGGKRGWA